MEQTAMARQWWQREDVGHRDGSLWIGNQEVAALAEELGTPLYLYQSDRLRQNLQRLHRVLDDRGIRHRIFYAMKSNRSVPLLTYLRLTGLCGIDACSPQEVRLARQVGFSPPEISFTGTALSDADLDALGRSPGLMINCDSLSSLRRVGDRHPGRAVGLRINPGLGLGYRSNPQLRYAGTTPTKFGIYEDQWDEAMAIAQHYSLQIQGLHIHAGCGYLTPQLHQWATILEQYHRWLARIPSVTYLNLGGGLGIPLVADDAPLDLEQWADIVAQQFRHCPQQIYIEPGDYIAKDAGFLVLQVTLVEQKQGTWFIGVNGGFNLHIEPAFYTLPLEIVPTRLGRSQPGWPDRVTVVGNINEALDVWGQDIALPPVQEGDYLCFLNAGGYGASMSSNHCMRGQFTELLLPPGDLTPSVLLDDPDRSR
jgi:diaminopimelate decarboxylase